MILLPGAATGLLSLVVSFAFLVRSVLLSLPVLRLLPADITALGFLTYSLVSLGAAVGSFCVYGYLEEFDTGALDLVYSGFSVAAGSFFFGCGGFYGSFIIDYLACVELYVWVYFFSSTLATSAFSLWREILDFSDANFFSYSFYLRSSINFVIFS